MGLSLFLTLPVCGENASPIKEVSLASLSEELTNIIQEQAALDREQDPAIVGWFSKEREALLETNQQVKKLILAQRRALVEVKIALMQVQAYPLQLMQAITWLAYALCVVCLGIIILVAVNVKTNLRV